MHTIVIEEKPSNMVWVYIWTKYMEYLMVKLITLDSACVIFMNYDVMLFF